MLLEKLAGYDVGLWDRSILTPESKLIKLIKKSSLLLVFYKNSLTHNLNTFFFLFQGMPG